MDDKAKRKLAAKMFARVGKSIDDAREYDPECWVWPGAVSTKGYPMVYIEDGTRKDGRRMVSGHRVALAAIDPAFPVLRNGHGGLNACHLCDVPACINPHHLRSGTGTSNSLDAFMKGRRKGTLTRAQREEATARYEAGGVTFKQLSQEYGLTPSGMRRSILLIIAVRNKALPPWVGRGLPASRIAARLRL